jgi:hypothetical protein
MGERRLSPLPVSGQAHVVRNQVVGPDALVIAP